MRLCLTTCLLLAALAAPAAGELPGVWFLAGGTDAGDQRRLVVGGDPQQPPAAEDEICLGWSWRDPGPDVELYPAAAAGTFGAPLAAWSLTAGGETVAPACRPNAAPAPFPRLGIGPADEVWLLAPAAPAASLEPAPWADLLHAVEAAWRQSTASPLGAQTIGDLAGCAVRSLPVDLDTRLDRWSPVERLAAPASGATDPESDAGDAGRDELIRTRRFWWWLESPAGSACTIAGGSGTLRLFPMPAEAAANAGGAEYFLTVAGVTGRRLPFSALDPDDWSPRLRRRLPSPAATGEPAATVPELAVPEIAIRPTPAQRQALLDGTLDLCTVEGLAESCARNAQARRQLYTAIERDAEIPWPEDRLRRTREACRAALASLPDPAAACTTRDLWQQPIAGALVAGFRGEIPLAERPAIRDTWHDGGVAWQLDGADLQQARSATPFLELELLDGSRLAIPIRALLDDPAGGMAPWQWWLLGAGAALGLAALTSMLLARRRPRAAGAPTPQELASLVEDAVERRLTRAAPPAPASPAPDQTAPIGIESRQLQDLTRRLVEEAVEARLAELGRRTGGHQARLRDAAQELTRQLEESSAALAGELRESLRHEAQSLIQGLSQDLAAGDSPVQRLRRELGELPEAEGRPVTAAVAALAGLGDWIERLWPVLKEVAGGDLASIPQGLSGPAIDEWQRATRTLEAFRRDAAVFSRLVSAPGDRHPDPAADAFLDGAGLSAAGRPVAERLKRYLEPFDHIGCLGEVTLALQYLVEAFPIEQLSRHQRARFRRELAAAQRAAGQEEDFHLLIARTAEGIGLRYRAVRYYKSRTDQSEHAFVRQQVTPISLSERVGFRATTDKATIVRLERPFFDQLDTGIYHAGHAHVAR